MTAAEGHGRERRDWASARSVDWASDLEVVRDLFRSYRAWLADHRDADPADPASAEAGLALVDGLLNGLPGVYGPPRGDVLLWKEGDRVVACGALREIAPGVGELKRISVVPEYRGGEFGALFVATLIERARTLGYSVLRADTLPSMSAAIEFYGEAGFRPIPAYWPHPASGALFFERSLER